MHLMGRSAHKSDQDGNSDGHYERKRPIHVSANPPIKSSFTVSRSLQVHEDLLVRPMFVVYERILCAEVALEGWKLLDKPPCEPHLARQSPTQVINE